MQIDKKHIIIQLQKEILPLQGLKKLLTDNNINIGFRPIENAFPNSAFPIGCMHEFLSASIEDIAPTNGFVSVILSKLMQFQGAAIWISSSRITFPAALTEYGINPEKIIFVDLKQEKDVLYAVEEALKCERFTTVVGEIKQLSFADSRRLQLAAEQSRVTGIILRNEPRILNTIAAVSRWRITSLPSELSNDIPGVGFPRWQVELLKIRNGKPGNWKVEWSSNRFTEIKENVGELSYKQIRKIS